MHHLFLALLCAAPLMMGYNAQISQPVPLPEASTPVETVYMTCMGCDVADCAAPEHYHHCPADCAEPTHYHDCPVGCADPAHPHCGVCRDTTDTAGAAFCPSMGCQVQGCTDPTHYHHCVAGCSDPNHYHDCPIGCQEVSHPHSGGHHGESGGHHGGRHH